MDEGVTAIPKHAFRNLTALETITLPGSVEVIEAYAFEGCTGLEAVSGSDALVTISEYAFAGCTSLTTVTLPETLDTLDECAFQDCSGLTSIRIPAGISTINSYVFSGCTGLREVDLPDTLTAISDYAFENCVKLETFRIPASVTSFSPEALSGTQVKTLRLASEDTPVALTLIDLEIPYIAEKTGIKDAVDRMLDRSRTDYYASASTISAAGQIPMTAKYAFKAAAADSVSDLWVTIRIPASETITPLTLKVNGSLVDYQEEDGQISFPVTGTSGTITFCLQPNSTNYLTSYATLTYRYQGLGRTETLGIVNMADDVLTMFVPAESASESIVASGVTAPNQEVSVYLDGVLVQTVHSSATGNYTVSLTLPSPSEGKYYQVEARIAGDNGKVTSVTDYVTYRSAAAVLTRFDMYYRGNQYDLLNMGSKSPVISWADASSFTFLVDFDDCSKVDVVRIVSTKAAEKRVLDAVYDKKQDRFVATGFTDYVPGTIYVEYSEQGKDMYAGASTQITSAAHDGLSSGQQVFYVNQGDESNSFYYLTEYESNAAFDYTAREYIHGTYEGKVCYMTAEPFQYEKDGGCFYAQEIYIREEDGSYTLVRAGVGLYSGDSGQSVQIFRAAKNTRDLQDTWEKSENLYELLTDTSKESSDDSVYQALYDYIDSAQNTVTDQKVKAELDVLRTELQVSELLDFGRQGINKAQKAAKHAIRNSNDPAYLLPNTMEDKMSECFEAMEDLAKKTADKHLQTVLDKLTDKGWFGGKESLLDKISKELEKQYKQSNARFRGKYAIDPSGYVYEAVGSNRISGVTATIYCRETMQSETQLWNAEEYDQLNPLYTDIDGCYAWDVPEGFWQVKYEKEGYETTYSEWLPVPPPQLDVNVGMISHAAPEIALMNAYEEAVDVVFSQYMDVETINSDTIRFEVGGNTIVGTWEAMDAEVSPTDSSVRLAKIFRFIPQEAITSEITCSINHVQNYAGKAIASISEVLPVKLDIKSVQVPSEVDVDYGTTRTVSLQAFPEAAAAGKKVQIICNDSYLLSVNPSAVFDDSGAATFSVTSLLPGTTTIKYVIEGTTYSGEIAVSSSAKESDADELATWQVTKENESEIHIQCDPADAGGKFLFATYNGNRRFLRMEARDAVMGSTIYVVTDSEATYIQVFWVNNDYQPLQPCVEFGL